MKTRFSVLLILLGLYVISLFFGETGNMVSSSMQSISADRKGDSLDVFFFYGEGCPHCGRVKPFLSEMEQKYPLNIHRFDIYNNRSCLPLFDEYSNMYELSSEKRGVPTIFVSDRYFVGDTPILEEFEGAVKKALAQSVPTRVLIEENTENSTQDITVQTDTVSIFAISIAALADSISPCSIAILVFLIGARVLMDPKKRALRIGLSFCLAVFIGNFLFGLGFLSTLQLVGFSGIFSMLAGLVALLTGSLYLKDALWHRQERSVTEVPRSLKPFLLKMLKHVVSPFGAFTMGFVVCLFELPCTGGPYIFILGQLANSVTRLQAIPWLIYYNLIFTLPLIFICLFLYSNLLSPEIIRNWSQKNKGGLKLASGLAMIAIGILVIPMPQMTQLIQSFLGIYRTVGPTPIVILSLYCFGFLAKKSLVGRVAQRRAKTLLLSLVVATTLILPSAPILLPHQAVIASPGSHTCYIQLGEFPNHYMNDEVFIGYASSGDQADQWCREMIDDDTCDWSLGVLIAPSVCDDPSSLAYCSQVGGQYLDIIQNDTTLDRNLCPDAYGLVINSDHITLDCNGHSLAGNRGYAGVVLDHAEDVTIKNCNVTGFYAGIYTEFSSNNTIYHNNFMNNTAQVINHGSANTWDDGYPSGGNYWGDYFGRDLYSGPYQNLTSSDGIVDAPYVIDASNRDQYPLVNPWPSRLETADLSVASPDIVFSEPNPSEGQTITVSATIHDIGERNLESINVLFFDGNISIGEQRIPFVSHHSQGTASIDWTADGEGFHLIKVVVDPENAIFETNEENNKATRSILVGKNPHSGGIVVNGSAAPSETRAGWSVAIQGHALYNTTYGAGELVAGAEITITIIGQSRSWTTQTTRTGDYALNIVAPYSPGNYVVIVSVTDYTFWNSIEIELTVQQSPPGVDLTLSQQDISLFPADPIENDNVDIRATIHNVGTANATNVRVAFHNNGQLIGNETINLILGGGTENIMITWNATLRGWHTIEVIVDPENTIVELNENNNEASKPIYVYATLPDLTPTNIDFSDSTPTVNQTIIVSANVQNIGGLGSNDVLVSYYDGDESIGNVTIPWIPGKSEFRTAPINHTFTIEGWHRIWLFVDPENGIIEADERNNQYWIDIYVHLPLPDLTLSSLDIAFSNDAPKVGDTIRIDATIHNAGEVDAHDVTVELLADGIRINCATAPFVPAGGQETVNAAWNATSVGWRPIKVIIDEYNTIPESSEDNNVATRYIYVHPLPEEAADLCIYSEDIVFSNTNPDLGEIVTIYARVHNIGEAEAPNVLVIFYIEDIQLGPPEAIPSIPVGQEATVLTKWIASQPGSHVVKVIVDTQIESNKNNNVATRAITVGRHDVTISDVILKKTVVGQGFCVNITLAAGNQGDFVETFNVVLYADTTGIQTQTVTLESGASIILTFTWNTTGFPKGNYTISAYAIPVPGETDLTDNTLHDGQVFVATPGDVNADDIVDIFDVATIGIHFGHLPPNGHEQGTFPYVQCLNADINNDGIVDILDIVVVAVHFGETS